MKRIAQKQGLAVYEYDARIVRQQICCVRHATKRQTIQRLIACYPVLQRYYPPASHAQEVYWGRLFAAAGVGVVCWQQLQAKDADG